MDGDGDDDVDEEVEKDDKGLHLHDLHLLDQVVFLSLGSILLKEVNMIKMKLKDGKGRIKAIFFFKPGVAGNHVSLIGSGPRNLFGFPLLNTRSNLGCQDFLVGNTFQFVPIGFGRRSQGHPLA